VTKTKGGCTKAPRLCALNLKKYTRAGDVAQVVERLSIKCKALSSNLNAVKKKKRAGLQWLTSVILDSWKVEIGSITV
jgi:hypothetical protein